MHDSGFASDFAEVDWAGELEGKLRSGEVRIDGRNKLYRLELCGEVLAVKRFGQESRAKNQLDRKRGSKAKRSFETAAHLGEHKVGTPAPVAWFEFWDGNRLTDSFLVTRFTEDTTDMRLELVRLFREGGICSEFMALLETVAEAIARMHACGVMHRDLGNQNILLRRVDQGFYDQVQFIDLNRARIKPALTRAEQGKDTSRIYLPSDLRRVFHEMMFAPDTVPDAFKDAEAAARQRFDLHTRSRSIRHPIRSREKTDRDPTTQYPEEKDLWVFDDRSEQAISLLTGKDKKRQYTRGSQMRVTQATAKALRPVWKHFHALKKTCFTEPVTMDQRVGITISGKDADYEHEAPLLEQLGHPPVLIRFYQHETVDAWQELIARVREMKAAGRSIAIALVQDRKAVSDPEDWDKFCQIVLDQLHDQVDFAEIGHAINRVKWGLWDVRDYARMLQPVQAIKKQFPHLVLTGPAVIDFEYQYLAAALDQVPKGFSFDALSHHLYVDRRGAPENCQGPYDTLDKAALARAAARSWPKACADRLIISEVNWPLKGTGVYSPVVSPYDSPGERHKDPSVTEEQYARYMIRYLLMTLCSGMAERVYWWKLGARGFGLVDIVGDNWKPRPAFHMMKTFIELTTGQRFRSKEEPEPGVHFYHFDKFIIAYSEHSGALVDLPFKPSRTVDAAGFELESGAQKIQLGETPCYFYHG